MEITTNEKESKTAAVETSSTANDKSAAVMAHLGGILFGFLPSLIVWLMKKDDKSARYVTNQAKEALNFQITVAIAFSISFILVFVLIGVLLIWVVWLADIVFCVLAARTASKGENYRYPVTLRLIK